MEEFRRKNIPVSWVLLDDGWSDVDRKNGTLRSFGADPSRFPKGLSHTVRLLKDEFGVETTDEARTKLTELQSELDKAVAEVESALAEAGA